MMGQDGSSVVGAMDDKLPTAYEESWNFSGGPGTGTSVGNNAFKYSYGAIDGVNLEASYVPSTATAQSGSTDIGITYTGIDGLTIGLASGTDDTAGSGAEVDEQAMYITYAYDAFTFGVQSNESDSSTAGADNEFSGYAVSYAVSDDLSVSLNQSEVDYESSTLENQEATGVSFSYTSGGLTVSATHSAVDNVAGSSTADNTGYEVNFVFAF